MTAHTRMPPKGRERGCVYRVLDKTIAVYMGTGTRLTVNANGVMDAVHGHVYICVQPYLALGTPVARDTLTLVDGQTGEYVCERVVQDYLPVEICLGRVVDLGMHVDMTTQRFTVPNTLYQFEGKRQVVYVLMDINQDK